MADSERDGDDDLVITPGGRVPRGSVHHVPPGSSVVRDPSGAYSVVKPGPDSLAMKEAVLSNGNSLVLTPGGYKPAELVHHVPPGTVIDGSGGRLRNLASTGEVLADYGPTVVRAAGRPLHPLNVYVPDSKVTPKFGSGWITYASWSNTTGTPVSRMATRWTVPPAPATANGQTVFLFPGIQNSSMIYQPVLQWGLSQAGGGNFWSVASWYADGQTGHSFYSNLVRVNVGD